MELQMAAAESEKNKINAVKAKELTGLAASRQIISTPGIFKNGRSANVDTPKRTPMRLGL